jgi:hypothetical protein
MVPVLWGHADRRTPAIPEGGLYLETRPGQVGHPLQSQGPEDVKGASQQGAWDSQERMRELQRPAGLGARRMGEVRATA